MDSVKVACMVVVCMTVMGTVMMEQAISCNIVKTNFAPYLFYLINGGSVSGACCGRVRNIFNTTGRIRYKTNVICQSCHKNYSQHERVL